MPTPTEVEARLRRTARACEPLVEDLMGDPPTATVVERGRPPVSWLAVAAALLVVLATVSALAGRGGDGGEDVRADPGPTPGATVEVGLADGSTVHLDVPGPVRWEQATAEVHVTLAALPGRAPLGISLEHATLADIVARGATIEQGRDEGKAVVAIGGLRLLVVEKDGWSAVVAIAAEDQPGEALPDSVVASLAALLDFDVTASGPVSVRGEGLEVVEVRRIVMPVDRPEARSSFQVAHQWKADRHDRDDHDCDPEPDEPPARCFADDTVVVTAFGDEAETALPHVDATITGGFDTSGPITSPVPTTVGLSVAFADGTTAELGLPPTPTWTVRETYAWVTLGSRPVGADVVRFAREDRQAWAAQHEADLVDAEGEGASIATRGPDRWVVVERDGWTAALAVAGGEVDGDFGEGLIADLGREMAFTVTPSGPKGLTGPASLTVTGVGAELRPEPATGDPADALLPQVGTHAPDVCDGPANPQNRCLADDRLVLTGLGTGGQAALAAMTAVLTG